MKLPTCLLACLVFSLYSYSQVNEETDPACRKGCNHGHPLARGEQLNYFQYPSMDKYDVKYLKLDLDLNVEPNNRNIAGTSLTLARTLQPLDSFITELKSNMIVDSAFVNGTKMSFQQANDFVFIRLSPAIPAGNQIRVLFYYRGTANATGVFSGISSGLSYTATLSESYQAREWFPAKQFLKDKIDSADIWLTTTPPNMAGANGLLTGITDMPGGKKRYEWKTRYPMSYYMPCFSVGNYMEYKNYAKPAAMAPDSILVQHYIYNNTVFFNSNKANLDRTPPFIEKMSELYGLYPFSNEKYGHLQANIGGGMEHQTMSTVSSFGATLVAHELGHQWFGDNVTCATWNHIWINEGFATYSEYLMIEKLPALFSTSPAGYMQSVHTDVLTSATGSVFVPDASLYDENRIFSSRFSYNKGAAIVHTLRFEMQNDNLFFQTLKNFQQQFKDSVATADDFKTVAQITTGKDFTDFFNQWYYGQGYPTFNVTYASKPDTMQLMVNQTVSAPAVTPFFKGLYEFTINTIEGDTTVKVYMTTNNQVFKFRSNRTPTGVVVDPNNWVLNKVGSIVTAIDDPVNVSNDVKLFPNPSPGAVELRYPMNWFNKVEVYDIAGKLLQQETISSGSVQHTLHSTLQSGLYFVHLKGKGRIAVKKLVIQHP